MVEKDITKIRLNGREWKPHKPVKKIKENVAWDTETIDGKPFLMANSNLKGVNYLFSDDVIDYFNLLTSYPFKSKINWWYNLDYDVRGLIKMLPLDNRYELSTTNSTEFEGFKLNYITGKQFKINKIGSNATVHYDLAQFYNMTPLKILADRTSYNKVDVEDIADIDINKINSDPEYRKLIIDRCMIDARITKELADQFTEKVNRVVPNNRYLSVASIARQYFLTKIPEKLKLPPKTFMGYALEAYHGGWIEALKLGRFRNAYNIDIVSAYPSVMADLYSCKGKWSAQPEYIPDTAYSFYRCTVDYYDDDISPLWFQNKDKVYHPTGKIEGTITGLEYDFLTSKGYDIKIKSAIHLLKSKDHDQPFKQLINDLFDKRNEAKKNNDEIQLIYKLILNSAYGCTINNIEKRIPCSRWEWEEDGHNPIHTYILNGEDIFYKVVYQSTSMYNPVFAAYITAGCRIMLAEKLWKHRDKVISINTDGAYLKSKIPVKNSNKLGEWSITKYDELLVMGNGRYFIYDDNGNLNVNISHFRGVHAVKKNMNVIDQQIKDNPDKLGVAHHYTHVMKEKESLRSGNPDQTNLFIEKTTNITFPVDRRYWFDKITCNADLLDNQYDSRPFDISEIP